MNCKRRARIAGLIGTFLFVLPRLVSAWLPGYDYRKLITLGGGSGAGAGYQIKLVIGESDGASGVDFHVEGHCANFPEDIRFTDDDGDTDLPYWLEGTLGTAPGRTATFWVKVADDLGSSQQIYVYYGNSTASSASSGDATFIFFDDFEDGTIDSSKWDKGGNMTETNGVARGGTTINDYFFGKTPIPIDTLTLIKTKPHATSSISRPGVLQQHGNPYNINGFGWQDYNNNNRYTDTYWNVGRNQQTHSQHGTSWAILEAVWQRGVVKFYVNGTPEATHTTYVPPDSAVLYGQVDGDADYDLFYTRKYVDPEPAFSSAGGEESPSLMIENVMADNITATSVDLLGNLIVGEAPVTVICYWGTSDGGEDPKEWGRTNITVVNSLGWITNSLTDLSPGTRYYFRYYATNSAGEDWANSSTVFSTLGAPKVNNDSGATNVGQTTAQLRGELLGGNPNPQVWIYWGTTDGATNKGDWDRPARSVGQPGLVRFDSDVSGLLANQTYWYRCYASNSYGEAWAEASTNFTTAMPTVAIDDVSVQEGRSSTTTNAIFTVSLSATSAVDVVVQWQTADGTATSADNDYQAGSGSLTITAGSLQGIITVTVNGDDRYEANETFYLNLTSAENATIADNQGVGTIVNDDWTFYVRGDGQGSDSNDGSSWSRAFATLQKALATIPKPVLPDPSQSTPKVINVQASSGSQVYDVAWYSCGYFNPGPTVDVEFQGGWQDVDAVPLQTGWSVVQDLDGTVNEPGIHIDQDSSHSSWKRVVVNRFVFTNVTRGVELTQGGAADKASIWLTVSNTVIHARNDGIYLYYPKGYSTLGAGGYTQIKVYNVHIAAGQDTGVGCGVYANGGWDGSVISAQGVDPRTGEPAVSTITAPSGTGVYFRAVNLDQPRGHFENTVIYNCEGPGIHLDAARTGYNGVPGSNRVQAVFLHCTIVDNGSDGLHMASKTAGSWACVTNCIFADNAGAGINLEGSGFVLPEGFNVFFNDILLVNGVEETPHSSSATRDPQFYAQGTKPDPWYTLGSNFSPAYRSGSDGKNRGAYQVDKLPQGSLLMLR